MAWHVSCLMKRKQALVTILVLSYKQPAAGKQVYHELVVMERLHTAPEFSPGASLEAITRPPLRFS